MAAARSVLATLLGLAIIAGPVAAFKAEEFKVRDCRCIIGLDGQLLGAPQVRPVAQPNWPTLVACPPLLPPLLPQKCADSAFCMRLRNVTSETFVVLPESVAVEGARVTATVANSADANGTFRLVLTAYGNTLRLFIDEGADKGRFQVPDVLLPGLEAREQVRWVLSLARGRCGTMGWCSACRRKLRGACPDAMEAAVAADTQHSIVHGSPSVLQRSARPSVPQVPSSGLLPLSPSPLHRTRPALCSPGRS